MNRFAKVATFLTCIVAMLPLAGCGGGGASTPVQSVSPQISVDWAARSRNFNGLTSAQSVAITIKGGLANGQDYTFNQDRSAVPEAYTGTYTSPELITVGNHRIDLKFYANSGAAGPQVGTASVAAAIRENGAVVRADGSPLGNIQTDSKIATVALVSGQSVDVGASQQLAFTAQDSNSQTVAVSSGSAFFSVTAGASKLTLSQAGVAQGVAVGDASVVVTVDGIASTPATVSVTAPAPIVRSFAANTYKIAYDKSRTLIYATVPANDPTNPSSLVAYDPATGAVSKALSLPSEPYSIALSDDFQYAYVSLDYDGKIARVDLNTFTVGQSFLISTEAIHGVHSMLVRPGHPLQLAVTHSVFGSLSPDLTIYDSGVAEPKGSLLTTTIAFAGPSKLYAGFFGKFKSFSVDDTGVTVIQESDTWPGHGFAYLGYANNQLFINDWGVYNADTFAIQGTFPGRLNSNLIVPDETGDYAYGLAWGTPNREFKAFRKSNFSLLTSVTIPDVGSSTNTLLQMSPTSFAFNVVGPSKIYVVEGVYLP